MAAAAAAKEAAEEAATGEAAAMLASLASEEHGDETGLQCEEALPAEDQAGKSAAGSPSMPSPAARGAEQHLGWKVQMTAPAEALKPAHVTPHLPYGWLSGMRRTALQCGERQVNHLAIWKHWICIEVSPKYLGTGLRPGLACSLHGRSRTRSRRTA